MVTYQQLFFIAEANGILCDFHRVQAWHRWIARGANKVANKSITMTMMKAIAEERSVDGCQLNIDTLLQSSQISNNVKNYFLRIWLPIKEVIIFYHYNHKHLLLASDEV